MRVQGQGMEARSSVGGSWTLRKKDGRQGRTVFKIGENSYWHLADRSQKVVAKVDHW